MSTNAKAHPDCRRDPSECRLHVGPTVSTSMGWSEVYDGLGKLVSEDPNWHATRIACATCHRLWEVILHKGKTEIKDTATSAWQPIGRATAIRALKDKPE